MTPRPAMLVLHATGDDQRHDLASWSLALPPAEGGTCCSVQVVRVGRDLIAAVVTELPDNPGRSVGVAFPQVALRIRTVLPPGSGEPLWVRRWPGAALADLVFRGRPGWDTHLMVETEAGWMSRPLPRAAARQLMEALARRSP